jgi:hypothetical protein
MIILAEGLPTPCRDAVTMSDMPPYIDAKSIGESDTITSENIMLFQLRSTNH